MKRIALACALALAAFAAPVSTWANDSRTGPPPASVFPVPRDPWRSWGVRRDPPLRESLPRHVGAPRLHGHVVVSEPVWVPKQWVWDGAGWVWWPGGWVQ